MAREDPKAKAGLKNAVYKRDCTTSERSQRCDNPQPFISPETSLPLTPTGEQFCSCSSALTVWQQLPNAVLPLMNLTEPSAGAWYSVCGSCCGILIATINYLKDLDVLERAKISGQHLDFQRRVQVFLGLLLVLWSLTLLHTWLYLRECNAQTPTGTQLASFV